MRDKLHGLPGQEALESAAVSPFPVSERVIYKFNPLAQVICQLRFSPILKIDAEPPAAFQEKIRAEYPLLFDRAAESLPGTPDLPPQVAELIRASLLRQKRPAAFDFVSADEKWTVSLTREFLSVATTDYIRWEAFKEHLETPLNALLSIYAPVFTRVGLRYLNIIRRSRLGLAERSWSALLKPHVTGILAGRDVDAEIQQTFTQSVIRFHNESGAVLFRHGLTEAEDAEQCYLIDSDFFIEKKRIDHERVGSNLNFFNQQSGRLFRWSIDDELHRAMEPGPVPA